MITAATLAERDQLAREHVIILMAPDGNGGWLLYEPGDTLPPQPPAPLTPRTLTQAEFLSRITPETRQAMIGAAVQNPLLNAVVLNMLTAVELHPDSVEFQTGLAAFVQAGAITQAQADTLSA